MIKVKFNELEDKVEVIREVLEVIRKEYKEWKYCEKSFKIDFR